MAKVVIHFGPPKTGTSAIQKWLIENESALKQRKILYPQHQTDSNGVSSGNATAIFNNPKKDKPRHARENKLKLKESCQLNNCNTLLFSSELFMRKLPELAKLYPNARFIGYIRAPIDLLESDYNQLVKRHSETNAFTENDRSADWQLDMLSTLIDDIGLDRFELRAYCPEAFLNGDLVADFLNTVRPGLESLVKDNSKGVNPSYSLQSLEFKRWLNQLSLERTIERDIDKYLQSLTNGINSYSLLAPDEYETYRKASINSLTQFNSKYPIAGFEHLLNHVTNKQQKPFVQQSISDDDFTNILKGLLNSVSGASTGLKEALSQSNVLANAPQRVKLAEALLNN